MCHIITPSNLLYSIKVLIAVIVGSLNCAFSFATEQHSITYKLYLDADQTNSISSGQSIELGIRAALNEVNWKLGGHNVELVLKDHHGSTPRSQYHLKQFLEDPHALAMFGGLHSPPLIASRDFINEKKILTLVPWAAATPITRAKTNENWIYRLSLDDSKAGKVIIEDTIVKSGFTHPFLLLEDTGWGKANKKTMTEALKSLGQKASGIHFFQWGIGQHEARAILEDAISQGADSFVMVANAPEGITFAKAMLSIEKDRQRPIRSHWGITGGTFFDSVGAEAVNQLDLRFIQTSFSFFDEPLSPIAKEALTSAAKVKGVNQIYPVDIKAPVGFIHAYDLTRLMIAATNEIELSGDAKKDSGLIKTQLENLKSPVMGLIKTYQHPFEIYQTKTFDAHEALGLTDFIMAKYDSSGNIKLIRTNETTQTSISQ